MKVNRNEAQANTVPALCMFYYIMVYKEVSGARLWEPSGLRRWETVKAGVTLFRSHHLIFHLFIELLIEHGDQERHAEAVLPAGKEEQFTLLSAAQRLVGEFLCYCAKITPPRANSQTQL